MQRHYLIEKGYIPLDKSWIIRMGVLDLLHEMDYTVQFLEKQQRLGDDLKALYRASIEWKQGKKQIHVGESATLYRFLQFVAWKLELDKELIPEGTLIERVQKFCNDPGMVYWSQERLQTIEDDTTQRASASVLCGDPERLPNPRPKLALSYEAYGHWHVQRSLKQPWVHRYDETILAQSIAFLYLLNGERPLFEPKQAEDYCFARAFDYMTKEEGEEKFPNLKGHESVRTKEMERALKQTLIDSKDHRVVQARVMERTVKGKTYVVSDLSVVNKSWPEFWEFLEASLTGRIDLSKI